MSMSTISGECFGSVFNASSAVAHAHAQRNSGSVWMNSVRLSRIVRLSSSIETYVINPSLARHREFQGRAAALLTRNLELSTQFFDARAHVFHAVHFLGARALWQ